MANKFTFTLILIILVISAFVSVTADFIEKHTREQIPPPTNFEECVAEGNPVMESYPRQCISKEGEHFVEEIEETKEDNSIIEESGCMIAGCSRQLCIEEKDAGNIFTSCEFLPEYACYKNAECERSEDDKCGWRQTEELKRCIIEVRDIKSGI